ncbi:MAG: PDZ domain-containing protein, partial [Acidobacteria bacterium]|nr:PDZ domain-containing protein [Acidobacteriota bacterium]
MNPYLRRIRWRLLWMSVLCLTMAIGGYVLTQWVYSYSDDQCTWRVVKGQVRILEILPNGVAEEAGLLEGDELLSIQGHPVKGTQASLGEAQALINSKPEGTVLSYAVRRGERTLYLPVRLVKPVNLAKIVNLVSGLIAWLLGLLVVISSPERKTSRHFFYLGCAWLLTTVGGTGFGSGSIPALAQLSLIATNILGICLVIPLLVHFFMRFPFAHEVRKRAQLIKGMYLYFAALGVLIFSVNILGVDGGAPLSSLGLPAPPADVLNTVTTWVQGIGRGSVVAGFSVSIALFAAGFFRLEPKFKRAILPCLLVTAAVLLEQLVMLIFSALQRDSLLFARSVWILLLPVPLVPLSFAYSIIRFGLFDVRKALLRWASYSALIGAVIAIYFGGIVWLFAEGVQSVPTLWMGILVGLLALPLGWVRLRLVRRIRKLFHRDAETAREALLGSLRDTRKRLSEEGVYQALTEGIEASMHPSGLWVLPFDRLALQLPACEGFTAQTLFLPASLARHARDNRELVLGLGSEEADWIREQGDQARAHVNALEAQILVLLMVADQPHAAVLVGSKYAELNYGRRDRELLREAAINGGVILETAVMHRRLVAQERATQELETARKIQEGLITSTPPPVPGFQ